MIKKIFHAADCHFFLAKKFEEHQFVCNEFYKELEKEKPDLCVLVGDLIDSKLKLGPEQIGLCRSFLQNIATYCPIIVILGNHELNVNSIERLDSLSPILYSLYNETDNPIHFLKHSGIYNLYGIDWAVWSCLDKQESPFVKDTKGENYTIGLYHGSVKGCVSENGFELSEGIDISEFDDCEIVLMGDIHTQQNFRNNQILFSGAFIQTKVTEKPFGTFVKWDWNGKTFIPTVKKLENIYSTVMDVIPDNKEILKPAIISSNQIIVLKYDPEKISKSEATEYKKTMQSLYKDNIVELRPVINKKIKLKTGEIEIEEEIVDIREYLIDYIKKCENLDIKTATDVDSILALDDFYSKMIDSTKDYEYGDYDIQKIIINNLYSFPPLDTEISFMDEGIIGINAKNRSGKSNTLKILQYVLFNSTPNNTTSLKKIINKYNRDKDAYAELYLSKNGQFFRIKRIIKPKKGSGVTTVLEFHQIDIDGADIRNLTGEKRQETEKEIQRYFGIESMFEILSVFSAQKKQTEYIDCKNAERLTLVNRFLGLHQFEQKEKEVIDKLKTDKAVLETLQKTLNQNTSLEILENEFESMKKEYLEKVPLTDTIQKILDDLILENSSLIKLYNETKVTANKEVTSPKEIKEKLNRVICEIDKISTEISNYEKDIEEKTNELEIIKNDFFLLTNQNIVNYTPDYKISKTEDAELAVNLSESTKLNNQLKINVCNNCGKEHTHSDKEKVKIELLKLSKREKELRKIIDEKNTKFDKEVEFHTKFNKVQNKMLDIKSTILSYKNTLQKKQNEKDNISLEDSEWTRVEEAKIILESLTIKVENYNKKCSEQQQKINDLNYEIKDLSQKLITKDKEIIKYKENKDILKKKEDEIRLFKNYRDIIHKDGLPLYILKSKIASINQQINLIVSQVFEFDIQFTIDEYAGELNINFIYPDDEENNEVSLASGAETFIINLCIKVGLSQISDLPKMTTLIIDEGYGTLDKDAIEKIPQLFSALTEYYRNVLTISHLEEIKDMCQNQIKLSKSGKYTEVIK